jgi:U4/U6.U5 tri-snRNP-associated protein 2
MTEMNTNGKKRTLEADQERANKIKRDSETPDVHEDTAKEETDNVNTGTFLETINRSMLDFDFEKLCSVSLSNLNVYACLVCGKYFQGRGKSSHAYYHSFHEDHHVFMNLETLKFYILPDNYEVKDASLNDIKVLSPYL